MRVKVPKGDIPHRLLFVFVTMRSQQLIRKIEINKASYDGCIVHSSKLEKQHFPKHDDPMIFHGELRASVETNSHKL